MLSFSAFFTDEKDQLFSWLKRFTWPQDTHHSFYIYIHILVVIKWALAVIMARCTFHKKIDNFRVIKVFIVELKFMMRNAEEVFLLLLSGKFLMVEWVLENGKICFTRKKSECVRQLIRWKEIKFNSKEIVIWSGLKWHLKSLKKG